jgi:hypothetical protein
MSSPFAETIAKAEAPAEAPAPSGSTRADSAVRRAARRDEPIGPEPHSTLTAGHRMAFHWLRSSDGEFGLVSCYVNGRPSALVVAAQAHGKRIEIMPLFVALTDGMRITDPEGEVIYEKGGVA